MAGPPVPVTSALIRRLEAVGLRFIAAWQEPDERVQLIRDGGALGTLDPSRPDLPHANRIHGLRPDAAGRVQGLLQRYAAAGVEPWLELAPDDGFERLGRALHAAGAAQIELLSLFVGRPRPARAAGVAVDEIGADGLDVFVDVLLAGHGAPEEVRRDERRRSFAHWAEVPGLRLYVASVDGVPAAAAALYLCDGVGYLANASTLPERRGLGCQTALLEARVGAAHAAGCELVSSLSVVAGSSQRNLERAGLRVACGIATWRVLRPR